MNTLLILTVFATVAATMGQDTKTTPPPPSNDFPSGCFSGPCWHGADCDKICRECDHARAGHCSYSGGKCWCEN